MAQIDSKLYRSLESYQEQNPDMKDDLPEYKNIMKVEDNYFNFIYGLFG